MENTKTQKPIIFLILKIISCVLLATGLVLIISAASKKVPEMTSEDWFDASRSKSGLIFGGVACLMIGGFLMFMAFFPNIQKTMIKTQNYVINENKEDLKNISNTTAEISEEAVTKTAKAVKKGLTDTMFCKECGEEIDADSKFCRHCGKKQ